VEEAIVEVGTDTLRNDELVAELDEIGLPTRDPQLRQLVEANRFHVQIQPFMKRTEEDIER
jgi:hypothetical protein